MKKFLKFWANTLMGISLVIGGISVGFIIWLLPLYGAFYLRNEGYIAEWVMWTSVFCYAILSVTAVIAFLRAKCE